MNMCFLNFKIKCVFLILFLIAVASAMAIDRLDPNLVNHNILSLTRYTGMADNDNMKVMNIKELYQTSVFKYFIKQEMVSIIVDNTLFSFNMAKIIRDALSEWNRVNDESQHITFQETNDEFGAFITFDVQDLLPTNCSICCSICGPCADELSAFETSGITDMPCYNPAIQAPSTNKIKVAFFQKSFSHLYAENETFLKQYIKTSGSTKKDKITQILQVMLKIVAIHEIGHVLGFGHSYFMYNQVAVSGPSSADIDIAASPYNEPLDIPIMMVNMGVYIEYLARSLGRQIDLNDIAIIPNEIRVARESLLPNGPYECALGGVLCTIATN